jgi:hypothetical protein
MSTYTDYFTKVALGYVCKVNQFANAISTGVKPACLERDIQVLYMYLDLLQRYKVGYCSTVIDFEAICTNINDILNDPRLGCFTVTDLITYVDNIYNITIINNTVPIDNSYTNVIIIGTTNVSVVFPDPLGEALDGSDYALKFTCYNHAGETVGCEIVERTNYGFKVHTYDEEDVVFEFTATLKNL